MHPIGSLVKLNRISEVLIHEHFFENLIKLWKISLVAYKNIKKVQSVPTRVLLTKCGPYKTYAVGLTTPD